MSRIFTATWLYSLPERFEQLYSKAFSDSRLLPKQKLRKRWPKCGRVRRPKELARKFMLLCCYVILF